MHRSPGTGRVAGILEPLEVTSTHLVFVQPVGEDVRLGVFTPSTGQTATLNASWVSTPALPPDGDLPFYTQPERQESDILAVDGLSS